MWRGRWSTSSTNRGAAGGEMTASDPEGAASGAEAEREEEQEEVFPVKTHSDSESEQGNNVAVLNRSKLLDFLQSDEDLTPTSNSDEELYQSLQDLKRKNRQCLLELGLMYQVQLENNHESSKEEKELEDIFQGNGRLLSSKFYEELTSGNTKRFNSLTDLTIDSSKDEHNLSLPSSYSKPMSASGTWISSITVPQPFKMTLREARKKSQLFKSHALLELETAMFKRQSQEEAECQKQFRAQPVPAHVYLPLYQEIMEKNEIRRQVETQKRRELLLSMQKPFTFQEKEEKRKEATRHKILDILTSSKKAAPKVRKKIPKSAFEPMLGDKLKEAELLRKIRIEMRAKDLLESSWAPIELGSRQRDNESRIASRNKEQKLSFIHRNFSFKPRINTSVPDFEGLHWAFQREALCRRENKEATHNKPFHLRTSNLHCKHQEMMDFQKPSEVPVRRSRSMTCLSSLSSNTLPIYITDAERKRKFAIKLRQENKKHKENESVRWAELQRKKSQAMHQSLNSRAKAMDPHKSLEETYKEKLKQNWQNDQRRTREYKKELEEMKMRVKNRPYLFEQVSKCSAQQGAERHFRDTLQQFGLNEKFVKNKGEKATGPIRKGHSASQRIHTSQRDTDIIKELSEEGKRRLELK
nr:protein FAM161B isoform X2 [Pogona vitticeps]